MGSTAKRKLELLLVGPLPPPQGGATRVFGYLAEDLEKDPRINLRVIDTSPGLQRNRLPGILRLLRTALQVLGTGWRVDVISYHASLQGRIWLGPVLFAISRVLRKPVVMRAFGGGFARQYADLPGWHRWILRKTYFRSEICLFQTKSAVEFFRQLGARRVEWFSNYTRLPGRDPRSDPAGERACRRLVFLGHVKKSKGVDVLLQAEPMLLREISIDIYGTLHDAYRADQINRQGNGRITYRGVLKASEVMTRLWEYDALVLPTYFPAEGYPGVILEAYAHGMPVIATDWMAIGEIVDSSSGILVEARNPRALADAANSLYENEELFRRLRRGAEAKSKEFFDRFWTENFVGWCYELHGGSAITPSQRTNGR